MQLRHPRRGPGAARGAVQPAGVDGGGRPGVGAVAARRVEDHVAAAADARVARMHRLGHRRHDLQAARDQLARVRPVDLHARLGGVDDRVEVAAEGHVVAQPADRLVARVQERLHVGDGHGARVPVAHRHAGLDQARRHVEAHHRLRL